MRSVSDRPVKARKSARRPPSSRARQRSPVDSARCAIGVSARAGSPLAGSSELCASERIRFSAKSAGSACASGSASAASIASRRDAVAARSATANANGWRSRPSSPGFSGCPGASHGSPPRSTTSGMWKNSRLLRTRASKCPTTTSKAVAHGPIPRRIGARMSSTTARGPASGWRQVLTSRPYSRSRSIGASATRSSRLNGPQPNCSSTGSSGRLRVATRTPAAAGGGPTMHMLASSSPVAAAKTMKCTVCGLV